MDGFNKYTWPNGNTYEGDWVDGKMQGRGRLETNDEIYEGDFFDNQYHGNGELKFTDGSGYYKGEFKNGNFEGKGEYNKVGVFVYRGDFKGGDFEGYGVKEYANGDVYEEILKQIIDMALENSYMQTVIDLKENS